MIKRKGQDIPEWGIVIAFITALSMVILLSVAPHMVLTLQTISNALNNGSNLQQQQ